MRTGTSLLVLSAVLVAGWAACDGYSDPPLRDKDPCDGGCGADQICHWETPGVDSGMSNGFGGCQPWPAKCANDQTCSCLETYFACESECGLDGKTHVFICLGS